MLRLAVTGLGHDQPTLLFTNWLRPPDTGGIITSHRSPITIRLEHVP